jgi:hypothetical protein
MIVRANAIHDGFSKALSELAGKPLGGSDTSCIALARKVGT